MSDFCAVATTNHEFLLDWAAAEAALHDGHVPGVASGVKNDALLFALALERGGTGSKEATSNRFWSPEEEQFVRTHHTHMTDAEMGAALGRSETGVKIYRNRILRLKAMTRLPEWPSLNQIAVLLGVDGHSVVKWANRGLIEWRDTGRGARETQGSIRVVHRPYLKKWVLHPDHWMMFKAERIEDPQLRRMVLARQAAWNDEWWRPGQVAAYWQCDKRAVNAAIHDGTLPAVRWGNWWIRKSVALRTPRPASVGVGKGSNGLPWSPYQDAFIVLGRAIGFSNSQMEQMGAWKRDRLHHRFKYLGKQKRIPLLLKQAGLDCVQWRKETKHIEVFADWRDYADRFPRLVRAIEAFKAGNAKGIQLVYVQAVLRSWARWYGPLELAQSLQFIWRGRTRHHVYYARLCKAWETLRSSGLEPL